MIHLINELALIYLYEGAMFKTTRALFERVVDMFVLQYMNTLTYLSREAFSSIPPELVPDLQRMLSANEAFRPTALDFTGLYIN